MSQFVSTSISLALGESIKSEEWLTYIPIWCAVAILALEGAVHLIQQRNRQRNLNRNIEKLEQRLDEK